MTPTHLDGDAPCRPDKFVVIKGSEFTVPVDDVALSIVNRPNPLLLQTSRSLESNKWGCRVVEDDSAQTSRHDVFPGGDAMTGAATVILAVGAGKSATAASREDLCG